MHPGMVPVQGQSDASRDGASPGPVRCIPGWCQSGASPGPVRGQSGASPGPVRGQSGASPGPVRGQSGASPEIELDASRDGDRRDGIPGMVIRHPGMVIRHPGMAIDASLDGDPCIRRWGSMGWRRSIP